MRTYIGNGETVSNFPCPHTNLSRANWAYAPGEPYVDILCLDCEHHVQLHVSEFPGWLKRDAPALAKRVEELWPDSGHVEPPDMSKARS